MSVAIRCCFCDYDVDMKQELTEMVRILAEWGLEKHCWPFILQCADQTSVPSLSNISQQIYGVKVAPGAQEERTGPWAPPPPPQCTRRRSAVPNRECAEGTCDNKCIDSMGLLSSIPDDHPLSDPKTKVSYKLWETRMNVTTGKEEHVEITDPDMPFTTLLDRLDKRGRKWFIHDWLAKHQAAVEGQMKLDLKHWHGDVILISTDFAENLSLRPTSNGCEKQSAYWSYQQVTIVPYCILRKWKVGDPEASQEEGLTREWFFVISNDLKHDNAFVQHSMDDVLLPWLETEGIKYDGIIMWTDGCAGQYKCGHQWVWISEFEDKHEGKWILHCFYASHHGKGPHDAAGHFVKKCYLDLCSKEGTPPQCAQKFFDWCEKEFEFPKTSVYGKELHHRKSFGFVAYGDVKRAEHKRGGTLKTSAKQYGTQELHCYGSKSFCKKVNPTIPGQNEHVLACRRVACGCIACIPGATANPADFNPSKCKCVSDAGAFEDRIVALEGADVAQRAECSARAIPGDAFVGLWPWGSEKRQALQNTISTDEDGYSFGMARILPQNGSFPVRADSIEDWTQLEDWSSGKKFKKDDTIMRVQSLVRCDEVMFRRVPEKDGGFVYVKTTSVHHDRNWDMQQTHSAQWGRCAIYQLSAELNSAIRELSGDKVVAFEEQAEYSNVEEGTVVWALDPDSRPGAGGRGWKCARPAVVLQAPAVSNPQSYARIQWLCPASWNNEGMDDTSEEAEEEVYEEWDEFPPTRKMLKKISRTKPKHSPDCRCCWGCQGDSEQTNPQFIHVQKGFHPLFD